MSGGQISEEAREAMRLAVTISRPLAGQPPMVQGAALADLVATWLAGHIVQGDRKATNQLRQALLEGHIAAVRELLPVNAARIHKDQR